MKFSVSHFFKDDEEAIVPDVDLVEYEDRKACEKACEEKGWIVCEIVEYNEEKILEENAKISRYYYYLNRGIELEEEEEDEYGIFE